MHVTSSGDIYVQIETETFKLLENLLEMARSKSGFVTTICNLSLKGNDRLYSVYFIFFFSNVSVYGIWLRYIQYI